MKDSRNEIKMKNINEDEFEKRVKKIIDQEKEELYREFYNRLGIEERRTEILERIIRIEEEIKSHRMLTESLVHQMDKRFEQVDKRFEQVDKRFEQVDKRFAQIDKRFEEVDKRFEQVDKRFEQLIHQMDKRFEQVDKRFNLLTWIMGVGFTVIISILITLLNYVLK